MIYLDYCPFDNFNIFLIKDLLSAEHNPIFVLDIYKIPSRPNYRDHEVVHFF